MGYNSQLLKDRRSRLPYLDTQTGIAQSPCNLLRSRLERRRGNLPGQIYSYPPYRWRLESKPIDILARKLPREFTTFVIGGSKCTLPGYTVDSHSFFHLSFFLSFFLSLFLSFSLFQTCRLSRVRLVGLPLPPASYRPWKGAWSPRGAQGLPE